MNNITAKEAKESTLEVWTYLAEHPEIKTKKGIPKVLYDKISMLLGRCALCEYSQSLADCGLALCDACPLNKAGACCNNEVPCKLDNNLENDITYMADEEPCLSCEYADECFAQLPPYEQWRWARSNEERSKAAQRIVDIVAKWEV